MKCIVLILVVIIMMVVFVFVELELEKDELIFGFIKFIDMVLLVVVYE